MAPRIDTRCRSDSDCVIRNLGNRCGYHPACVDRDSPADPVAVQADCRRRGLVSACSVPSIQACGCVAQHCAAANAAQTAFGPL